MIIRSAYDSPNWLVNGSNFDAYLIVVNDNGLSKLVTFMFIPVIISYGIVGLIMAFGKAASGANFVLWKKAAVFSTPAIVGFSAAIFMFISLSFDRLLAVALPIL
uniref:Transport system permease n=1 Tax=Meloidogyne hapla TaxID=6305 RepID=A0A1I8AXF0_MELHA